VARPKFEKSPPRMSDLLALALSRPNDAMVTAREVLASRPDAEDASIARQTLAIVLRDRGEVAAAIKELRLALKRATTSGNQDRETDVLATLGVSLAWAGRSRDGLALLDRAVARARGAQAGRVLMRRAATLKSLGRYEEALEDLGHALRLVRRSSDSVWEARSLTHRAAVYLALGETGRARADYTSAEELFASSGQELEYAQARHNRGCLAADSGDLPTALTYFEEAARRYAALDAVSPDLALDRCATLLAAGMPSDAMREADAAASEVGRRGGDALRTADLTLAAANAALSASETTAARERAELARRSFRMQGRALWEARAELVLIRAQYATGVMTPMLLNRAERITARLDSVHDEDAPHAHLVTGRISLALGHTAQAAHHLDCVARLRRRGSAISRSLGWLGRALQAEAQGNARAILGACARGLDALDEHRGTFGATELRARATAHGAELALIAQREALRRGDPRLLLSWSERWRATALAPMPARPSLDKDAIAELSALRAVTRMHDSARAARSGNSALDRERHRLERAVRERALRARSAAAEAKRFDLEELMVSLGDTRLVELIETDGALHVITVADGRVRRHAIESKSTSDEVGMARSVLARFAVGTPSRHADDLLNRISKRLEQVLLGSSAFELGDGPVVVVPPGRLHAIPWSLLPSLRDRVVSVAPSASTWMRVSGSQPPETDRVALIVGPGLETAGAEVPLLASRYVGATVLGHGTATAENVLKALDGAWLAHIAAHGTFRADNPLFSALRLDDGPLNVHDFERLRRAPYRLVLSSCSSGVAAPVGADELLGLVSSVIPLGAGGILASVVPVNDRAAVPLMVALHDALRDGASLPEALLKARTETCGDPVSLATALSFIALGI
jgi:tetratricopeptide (TPR) repeat protein